MTDSPSQASTLLRSATELGPVVRERRKSQSLRIDAAAGLLGVSVDLMSRLENGQGSVRMGKALAVLDGLGLALMVLPKAPMGPRGGSPHSPPGTARRQSQGLRRPA